MGIFKRAAPPACWYVQDPPASRGGAVPAQRGPYTREAILSMYTRGDFADDGAEALLWTTERIFPDPARPRSSRPVNLDRWRRWDELPDPVRRVLEAQAVGHAPPQMEERCVGMTHDFITQQNPSAPLLHQTNPGPPEYQGYGYPQDPGGGGTGTKAPEPTPISQYPYADAPPLHQHEQYQMQNHDPSAQHGPPVFQTGALYPGSNDGAPPLPPQSQPPQPPFSGQGIVMAVHEHPPVPQAGAASYSAYDHGQTQAGYGPPPPAPGGNTYEPPAASGALYPTR
jgi:hypothetical protein